MTPILYFIEFASYEETEVIKFFYDDFDARRFAHDHYSQPGFTEQFVFLMKVDMNNSQTPEFVETLYSQDDEARMNGMVPEGWKVAYVGSVVPNHTAWKVRLERIDDPKVFVSEIGPSKIAAMDAAVEAVNG